MTCLIKNHENLIHLEQLCVFFFQILHKSILLVPKKQLYQTVVEIKCNRFAKTHSSQFANETLNGTAEDGKKVSGKDPISIVILFNCVMWKKSLERMKQS